MQRILVTTFFSKSCTSRPCPTHALYILQALSQPHEAPSKSVFTGIPAQGESWRVDRTPRTRRELIVLEGQRQENGGQPQCRPTICTSVCRRAMERPGQSKGKRPERTAGREDQVRGKADLGRHGGRRDGKKQYVRQTNKTAFLPAGDFQRHSISTAARQGPKYCAGNTQSRCRLQLARRGRLWRFAGATAALPCKPCGRVVSLSARGLGDDG